MVKMDKEEIRLTFVIDKETFRKIEEFRISLGKSGAIPNRSEAIRELIKKGLKK
jgi:metal-responsive CopG/Arc/MetJ family transcriptional regulator